MLGTPTLQQRNDVLFLYFYSYCLAFWIVVQVCVFSMQKDSGIWRDKMEYEDNKNYGTKRSGKNRFGSVSEYCTDITW